MRDALLRARSEFGDAAIVIQQELAPGGGVTLSVTQASGAGRSAQVDTTKFQAVVSEPAFDPARMPLVREVAQRLEKNGASREFVASVCNAIREWADPGVHVMDRAAEHLGRRFPVAHLKRIEGCTRIVAFVGLTGVGKTTTLVKLAARMLRANRRVELATLDSRRVGAVEQLRAWARQLGVPLTVLDKGVRPHAKAFEGARVDAVLLDTTGNTTADVEQISALKSVFTGARVAFDVFLVLPATASREALQRVTQAYSALAPEGLVITKLDETSAPATVLEHALAGNLPIAFLTDGPDTSTDFHRFTPEACADLFLRGRLA